MNEPVKVYLLNDAANGRPLFYAEPPKEVDPSALPTHKGLHGWFEAQLRKLRGSIQHSENLAARWSRSLWEKLQRTTHPDEALLARLRTTRLIDIHHPSTLTRDEAHAAWSTFLGRSRRRHWPWFVVNLMISPLTLILGPLPGPNLVGYWIAYRAVHHWLILLGLGHARKGQIETRFQSDETLNGPIGNHEPRLSPGYDTKALGEFLRRHGVRAP